MNPPTPTPTPRTDAAWAKTFEDDDDQCRAGNAATDMREECAKLEAELITEQARLDYLALNMGTPRVADALDLDYSLCFPIRDAIDLAMKNESNTP